MSTQSCRQPSPIPSPGSVAQTTGLRWVFLPRVHGARLPDAGLIGILGYRPLEFPDQASGCRVFLMSTVRACRSDGRASLHKSLH